LRCRRCLVARFRFPFVPLEITLGRRRARFSLVSVDMDSSPPPAPPLAVEVEFLWAPSEAEEAVTEDLSALATGGLRRISSSSSSSSSPSSPASFAETSPPLSTSSLEATEKPDRPSLCLLRGTVPARIGQSAGGVV
uniref:Uncharacterized protein n=1 Tax=Hymenolepis diminuta TaxID=6216 RepID=A0A158QEW6_HYMDI